MDYERLIELYESGASYNDISADLGVPKGSIGYHLKKAGSELNRKANSDFSILYHDDGYEFFMSGNDKFLVHQLLAISEGEDPDKVFSNGEYHVHHKNHIPWDNRPSNIELNSASEHAIKHNSKKYGNNKYRDKDWLYQKYVIENLTQMEIAKECGVTDGTICNWINRFGIEEGKWERR